MEFISVSAGTRFTFPLIASIGTRPNTFAGRVFQRVVRRRSNRKRTSSPKVVINEKSNRKRTSSPKVVVNQNEELK